MERAPNQTKKNAMPSRLSRTMLSAARPATTASAETPRVSHTCTNATKTGWEVKERDGVGARFIAVAERVALYIVFDRRVLLYTFGDVNRIAGIRFEETQVKAIRFALL